MTGFKKINNSDLGSASKHGGDDNEDVSEILNGGTVPGKTAQIGKQHIPLSVTIADYSSSSIPEDVDQNNGFNATNSTFGTGITHVVKFSGLTPGKQFTEMHLDIVSAFGDVRIKAYDEVAGEPTNLLGESGTITVGGTGEQTFIFPSPIAIPSNGIVWVGFEQSNGSLNIRFGASVSGSRKQVAHTYGAGPDPFGTATNLTSPFWCRIVNAPTNPPSNSIDNNTGTKYASQSKINPEVTYDIVSLQEVVALAIYRDALDTTTEITIELSPDNVIYTLLRTINTTFITTGQYIFVLINRPLEKIQFIRIRGTDGTAKIMSYAEIKIRTLTESVSNRLHEHRTISTTDILLKPNGDP